MPPPEKEDGVRDYVLRRFAELLAIYGRG